MKLRNPIRDAAERLTDRSAAEITELPSYHLTNVPDELQSLQAAHDRRPVKVIIATIAGAAQSGFMTGKGLIEKSIEVGAANVIGMGTAVCTAIVACALLTTASMSLFGIAMDAAKSQRLKVALLAGALMVPIIGVSTHYAVLGNAGAPSIVYSLQDSAEEWKAYYNAQIADAAKADNTLDIIIPIRDEVCQKAKDEVASGRYSGASGYGQLTQSMDGICLQMTAIAETLAATSVRTEDRDKQAQIIIASLLSIPKDQSIGDVFARQDRFKEQSNALLAIIEDSASENVEKRLIAQLGNLEAVVSSAGVQDGKFGQTQYALIGDLQRKAQRVSSTITTMISDSDTTAIAQPAPLPDMSEAVMLYWQKNIPQILLALLLDLMPLWFCAMLITSREIPQARQKEMLDALASPNPTND